MQSFFKTIGRATLFLLCLFGLTRGLFLTMNPSLFVDASATQVLMSFIYGLRFDLSSIAMANGVLFLFIAVFLGSSQWWFFPGRIFFTLVNGIFIGLNVMDSEFFKFNGKRFGKDYLQNTEDLQRHSLSVFITYWWLFSLFLIALIALYFVYPRIFKRGASYKVGLKTKAFLSVLVVGLTVVGVRGGLQLKPISLVTAYTQGHQGLGALVLNTPFTLIKGHSSQLSEAPVFNEDLDEALHLITSQRVDNFEKVNGIQNVVIIVIESLSLEYTGLISGQTSYTPFIDELSKRSVVFVNNYANGRRSIEAMPSIFCGIPSLTPAPIITSSLSQNELHCLPSYLKNYTTGFFHGAHNGSFHMDSFSHKAGFQNFYGFDEYPTSEQDSDGHWGILDEPMFQFMAKELSSYKEPFLAGIFTLSSHHPYFIPKHLNGQFKEGPLEIHKSIGYGDYALKKFFESAKAASWFENTLFIITGDHTQKNYEKSYQYFSGNYRVPLIVYSEADEFKRRFLSKRKFFSKKVSQAVDIPHLVLDVLGEEVAPELPPFGSNPLREEEGLAINFDGYQYWLRYGSELVAVNSSGEVTQKLRLDPNGFYESELLTPSGKSLGLLKAMVSFFNKSMRQNTLYKLAPPSKN